MVISSLAVACARCAATCSRCRVLSRMPASLSSCWTVDAWLRKSSGFPLVSICSVGSIPPFMYPMAASWATAFWLPAIADCARAAACFAIFTSELACASWIFRPSYCWPSESTSLDSLVASATRLVERRLRAHRLSLARAALEQDGHGDRGCGERHDSSDDCTHVDARY